MNPQSIVLMVSWYGPYPWYFPYFIHTIGFNHSVDFIIVTDNTEEIPNKPDNLKIVYRTIDQLKEDFSRKLGFGVSIDSPYKLCDFKPAYGFLFQDLIQGYDFWGHIDLDIVFGDIREFMTDELLQSYDVISCRHDFTAGYFTLYRNNDYCNMLFTKSNDFHTVFSTPNNYWFDECGIFTGKLNFDHSSSVLKDGNNASILNFPNVIQSMTYVVIKATKDEGLRAHFDLIILDEVLGKIRWKGGKIYYDDMLEAMFYHLYHFKNRCKNKTVILPISGELYFTPNRILKR